MTIRFASREFAPRAFTTMITIVVFALLIALGRWQIRRAAETRTLWNEFAAGADAAVTIDAGTPPVRLFTHLRVAGRYDPAHQILIDGMEGPGHRNGYYVLTPFELAGGGWIMVNRGWIPRGTDPRSTPAIAVANGPRTVVGRADELPRPGIRLGGGAPLAPPFPVIALYPRQRDLGKLLHITDWARAAPQVLLDPNQPDGYYRHWTPPGFPPIRHTAYAVQWFLLAATLLVIYVVTNLRPIDGGGTTSDD